MPVTAHVARKKIISHVQRRGKFIVTDGRTRYWFRVINKAVFDGKLQQPEFVIRNLNGTVGLCHPPSESGYKITISLRITTRELFLATLAHEMVHLYQLGDELDMHHNKSFKEWQAYILYKMGITI